MSEHDALSVIGQLAGLGEGTPAPEPITPEQLIEAFCTGRDSHYSGNLGWHDIDAEGNAVYRGFCGYNGRRDTQDSLLTGFDDGYDFMGHLQERGWAADSRMGEWPYVVFLHLRTPGRFVTVSYCEADLTVTEFPTREAQEAYRWAEIRFRNGKEE